MKSQLVINVYVDYVLQPEYRCNCQTTIKVLASFA